MGAQSRFFRSDGTIAIRMRLAGPTLPSPGVVGVNLGIRGFPVDHVNAAFGWVRGPFKRELPPEPEGGSGGE